MPEQTTVAEGQTIMETIYLDLPQKPTREELADLALQDGTLWQKKCKKEAERKKAMDKFKKDIDNLDTLRREVMKTISGQDLTTVKCEATKDADGKIVKVKRMDTGEEVEDVQQIKLGLGDAENEQDAGAVDEGSDQNVPEGGAAVSEAGGEAGDVVE